MKDKHKRWLETAYRLAEDVSPFAGARVGAIIVHKGEAISFGVNRKKTHPLQKQYSKNKDAIYLHAEIDAISNAIRRYGSEILQKSTLYIARAKWSDSLKDHQFCGLAKPCPGCQKAIDAFELSVYYTPEGR